MKKVVNFKSLSEYYKKEMFGLKRNTVREMPKEPDERFVLLEKFSREEINNLFIRIIERDTTESFERQITDVTYFKGVCIISW